MTSFLTDAPFHRIRHGMMNSIVVALKPLHPKMQKEFALPTFMSAMAAGADVVAAIDDVRTLAPGMRMLVPCGFSMALPPGYEAQIRPRSGLALKHGVTVLNTPGTIDADYRGEVMVCLINHGQEPFRIEPGMRIAQIVIAAVASCRFEVVTELDATERGAQGYGSTGTK